MISAPRSLPPASAGGAPELDLASLRGARLLSARGDLLASAEEAKLLCLLSDGRLLVAAGHEMNPHVLSYRARLERLHHAHRPVAASFDLIARVYQAAIHRRDPSQDHTKMQIYAKDLLKQACAQRASDIHIRVGKGGTEILFRVHNDLTRICDHTREHGERLLATMYAAMTTVSDNAYKPNERQDASIGDRDKLPDMLYGVRIATAPTSDGSVMVLRLLYNDAGDDIDLQPLGFSVAHASMLQLLKDQPIGLNIISGPTGSGKSTTLQRVLAGQLLQSQGRLHVITVEDPVEYPIAGAVQTPVTNVSTEEDRSRLFSAAIANAMRLDPDTIMIGEVRDRASAQSTLRAAMTGHQVWTTVHANNAMAIIDRLVDLGLPLPMLADPSVTTGLISQRLVKLLCPGCRVPLLGHEAELAPALLRRVKRAAAQALDNIYLVGPGCALCSGHGTRGRTVVAEVLLPDAKFFDFIRAGQKLQAAEYWLHELGGRTVLDHAVDKIVAGQVDPRMAEQAVGHLTRGPASGAATRLTLVEATHAI